MLKNRKKKELEKAGVRLPRRIVKRSLIKKIIPYLKREEIIVITGARQTGKSVLLYQLIYNYLLPKTENIYYFNLDIPKQLSFFESIDRLIDLVTRSKGKTYIFIDEVQRLKEPGLFLKGIYDLHLPVKLIVSGSSALEIKSKVHEALTGRKILFHLDPFNLEELSQALFPQKSFNKIIEDSLCFKTVFKHYLIYGGYPAVALAGSSKLKLQLLKEIFQSYLEKDVKALLKVENENAFFNLIKVLSSQIGNLINKDELSNVLRIHKNTLENYLFYLEQTFILDLISPFYKNPRKELLKSPKIYFHDLGIRNFAIRSFQDMDFRPDKGALFENFSYLVLREKLNFSVPLHFWRTKSGAEVDFVIVPKLTPIPFEVKAKDLKEFKISKSLRSFLHTYRPREAYYLNLSLSSKCRVEETTINFLTPQDLIKMKELPDILL